MIRSKSYLRFKHLWLRVFMRHKQAIVLTTVVLFITMIFLTFNSVQKSSRSSNVVSHENDEDNSIGLALPESAAQASEHRVPLPKYVPNRDGNFEHMPPVDHEKRRGDWGEKFYLQPSDGVPESEVRSKKREYGMNMAVSEHIPMDRTVPDKRHPECKHWDYPEDLPLASVVIVFHNEGLSTLMRTVHSVLLRSPQRYLRQVLLVDDFSDKENLKAELDDYLLEHFGAFQETWTQPTGAESMLGEPLNARSGKVRLVRNQERSGLIRSRAHGASEAIGEVVVFLDAHCEVNYNWLVPLLAPIAYNPRTMTVPIIDGIDSETFEYRPVYENDKHFTGIWEWGMLYKEMKLDIPKHLREHRFSEPYESPTHAGGLLAISKKFFFELGGYDEGLLVWGGENFELSFKVWQCGGRLLWVPCSRVGHIYRQFMPYTFGTLASKRKGPLVLTNYKRVIEVWFDQEFKEYFYTREPLAKFYDSGDIRKQIQLKKQLKCKSFKWFIDNHASAVYQDFPPLPPNDVWGEVRTDSSNICLDSTGAHPPSKLFTGSCHGHGGNQLFRLNTEGQLGLGERCIDVDHDGDTVSVHYCQMGTVNGPWKYDRDTKLMHHKRLDKCMEVRDNSKIHMVDCDEEAVEQRWIWKELIPDL